MNSLRTLSGEPVRNYYILVDDVIFRGENITEKTDRENSSFGRSRFGLSLFRFSKSKNINFLFGLGHVKSPTEPNRLHP